MTHGNALWLARVASSLALLLDVAQAHALCRASAAVDLTIELEPPEASARGQLQQLYQRLDAELRLRELDACPAPEAQRRRAHVYVLAQVPELSPTLLRVYTEDGARLERTLDVAALPAEARPSAIASAADELLSALLDSTLASSLGRADGALAAAAEPKATPVLRKLPRPLPEIELGLGGGGSLFRQQGMAYGAEVLARWRPAHMLSAALSLGADRGSAAIPLSYALLGAPLAGGRDLSSGWHVGLEVGFDLLEPADGLWLAANGGLTLAHVQRTAELDVVTPEGADQQLASIGSSWELAASGGGEVSYRIGPWGIAVALALLVPLTPPEVHAEPAPPSESLPSQWDAWDDVRTSGVGFGEQLGGQLELRVWFALGS